MARPYIKRKRNKIQIAVSFTEEEEDDLRREAEAKGISMSGIIRLRAGYELFRIGREKGSTGRIYTNRKE